LPLSTNKITTILDQFEATFLVHALANKGRAVGCVVCKRADVRDINRTALEGVLNDSAAGRAYGFSQKTFLHHKKHCLVKYGGAAFSDLERSKEQRHKLFPILGKESSQKLFVLKELLFVRDEALKNEQLDRKELSKLIKEIAAAAAEYRLAREAGKKKSKEKPKADNLDDEFTSEQLEQMEMVKKRIAEGSNGGPRQAE
jgi:hypothetical protein